MSSYTEKLREMASDLRAQAGELDALAELTDSRLSGSVPLHADDRVRVIVEAVGEELSCPLVVLLSRDRTDDVVTVRDAAARALRTLLGLRLQAIAVALARKDHATIVAALLRIKERILVDQRYADMLDRGQRAAHAALAKLEGISA